MDGMDEDEEDEEQEAASSLDMPFNRAPTDTPSTALPFLSLLPLPFFVYPQPVHRNFLPSHFRFIVIIIIATVLHIFYPIDIVQSYNSNASPVSAGRKTYIPAYLPECLAPIFLVVVITNSPTAQHLNRLTLTRAPLFSRNYVLQFR
ncbi:hypothetical protein CVT25_008068 [Psilocybe cyanescens]|uniref:Uncharacterized protein n=1 Tax=Psilocybe cyanescens TaxID=93625 RepID=A0A409XG97_PSICY|nr:hypothetical protein CVT25_008068 [Psilocybe cyanescens]